MEDLKLKIRKSLSIRCFRIAHFPNAAKWSAVVIIYTTTVYGVLNIYRPSFSSYIQTPFLTSSEEGETILSRNKNMAPIERVYYLKTHKTGSTTIYSILAEYCRSHDVLPLLPVDVHINLSPPFNPHQVMLHPNISTYDMVFNHHVYDPEIFKYLHNDTFKFTTLREPFSHFLSSFAYFRDAESFKYLTRINTSSPLETFLANPTKYEAKGYASLTNNRQSMDLGYNMTHSFHDMEYIQSFIKATESHFHLVLITGYFHESLILLKRLLRWQTSDILYYRKLTAKTKVKINMDYIELYRQQHQNFSIADIELYNHFLPLFKERISKEKGLSGEVKEFESVLKQVYAFCDNKRKFYKLFIRKGRWTDAIHLFYSKCKWLLLDEVPFTKHLQNVQKFRMNRRKEPQKLVSTPANL